MNIGVIGCGSIGERHIANLSQLGGVTVFAHDASKETMQNIGKKYGIESFEDANMLFEKGRLDAVFICTPTHLHAKFIKLALEKDCHVFVEKPISHNLAGLDEMEKLADKKNKMIFVACNMRFHNSVKRIKSIIDSREIGRILSVRAEYGHYLPNWRPSVDYAKTYSASEKQGGGILLDSIHEFDYLSWMLGEPSELFCFAGKLSDLEIDTEDVAEVLLNFGNRLLAEVHVDYVQRSKRRSCQIIGTEGTVIWESTGKKPEKSEIRQYNLKKDEWAVHREIIEPNDAYLEQTKHFVNCLKGSEKPISNAASGVRALKIVLLAKESAAAGKAIKFRD